MRISIKLGLIALAILIVSSIVLGLDVQVIYNPFTGNLDYIRTANWTDTNMTLGNVTITGDLNMTDHKLTDVGELIVAAITLEGNIIPDITNLYTLGNSTNRFDEIWARKGNFMNINTTNLTTKKGDIENITTEGLNLGVFRIQNDTDKIVVVLG